MSAPDVDALMARVSERMVGAGQLMMVRTADLRALLAALAEAREEVRVLRLGLDAVAELIDESQGVTGLHRNGDIAPWAELRTGGRYEAWLADFDAARAPEAK